MVSVSRAALVEASVTWASVDVVSLPAGVDLVSFASPTEQAVATAISTTRGILVERIDRVLQSTAGAPVGVAIRST